MTDALDRVNEAFHGAYDERREAAANEDPILVVLADELVLVVGKSHTRVTFTPEACQVAKKVSHAPVALWLRGPSAELRALVTDSLKRDDLGAELRVLLEETLAAIDDPQLDRDRFAAKVGPALHAAIEHATKLQLAALDAKTNELVATLRPEQRKALAVAVTGDHQARVRSIGMQYFTKRLGGDRVLYAEGVADVDAAAALVGVQRLDRAMAAAFFGDPRRMQRDLLGDVAKALLDASDLAPIA